MVQFKRFVEPGRLALITYGPDQGKMCTIVDIIDHRRVIIEGPTTDVARQQLPIRWITLTSFKSEVTRGMRSGLVKKVIESSNVLSKWEQTAWAQKLAARTARKNMGDFARFQAMHLKKRKAHRIRTEINKLKRN
jgi:large subunit ribosomal protein L14e